MNGSELFVHLLLRLRHYSDAAVLWVLIKEGAEIKEFKTTSMLISHVHLVGTVDRWAAHRSIKSLQAQGLIKVRVHRKTATLIAVDKAAVLGLLRKPLDGRLPGLSLKEFPFLSAWSEDAAAAMVVPSEGSQQEASTHTKLSGHERPDFSSAPADATASIS